MTAMTPNTNTDTIKTGSQPPTISAIKVSNFKRIDEVAIELSDITYLVGGNNSGKSSLLQAIHTAYSCARLSFERGGQRKPAKVIPEVELLYRPTAHFTDLGHNRPYRGPSTEDKGIVEFVFEDAEANAADDLLFTVSMYKAHNHNNAGVETKGNDMISSAMADKTKLFSVYVPGLTGIPLYEEYKSLGVILRTAAGGEANLAFRNILLHLDRLKKRKDLQDLLSTVLDKKVEFEINFDDNRSQYIDVKLKLNENPPIPIDLWGTGVLQITQMLAYALLFQPALFLIDEPDSHLHPSLQRELAYTLDTIAKQLGCRIIITTHSRHMITAAPSGTRVIWMKDGMVVDPDAREVSEILLDLGALDDFDRDARIVMYTEDAAESALKQCLESSSHMSRISFLTYDGLRNAPKVAQMNALMRTLNKDATIVIHRDRDCLTDDEIERWSKEYVDAGMYVFVPDMSDTESYYCLPTYMATALNISPDEAERRLKECLSRRDNELRSKFDRKRECANKMFWAKGGSPLSDELWTKWSSDCERPLRHICGKDLLGYLKSQLRNGDEKRQLGLSPSSELKRELDDFFTSHLAD